MRAHAPAIHARTATVQEHVHAIDASIHVARALVARGVTRSRADRLAAATIRVGREGERAAFDLTALIELLRTRGTENDTRTRALVDVWMPEREPPTVRVHIDGPEWLDRSVWLPHGPECAANHARRILSNLDELRFAGTTLRVSTVPIIRASRGQPFHESLAARRRRLFSRWNDGIRVDDEGLISATPEALADQICRDARGVVMDGTAGVGAIAIALARRNDVTRVLAVDTDATRLAMARHNAGIYGVTAKLEFVHDDVRDALRRHHRIDALVLDPPWGGRDYDKFRMTLDDIPMDVLGVFARAPANVVLKLPRSFDPDSLPGPWTFEAAVDSRGSLKFLVARRGTTA